MTYDEGAPPNPSSTSSSTHLPHVVCTLSMSPSDRFMCWPRSGFVLVITQAPHGKWGIGIGIGGKELAIIPQID